MDSCIWKGLQISALELKNKYGHYITEKVLEYRKASQSHELSCKDCGTEVELRAGEIIEPYFAHRDPSRICFYEKESTKETVDHKDGKRILYFYFKELYPDANVYVDYHHKDIKRRSDVFIEFADGNKLAVEYQKHEIKIPHWEAKHRDYNNSDIKDLWILSHLENMEFKEKRQGKIDMMNFFEQFILTISSNKIAKYLNTTDNSIILASLMVFKDEAGDVKYRKIFSHKYALSDVKITSTGEIDCDFMTRYLSAQSEFLKASEEKHQKALADERELRINMLKKQEEKQVARKIRHEETETNSPYSSIPKDSILTGDPYGTCVLCGQYTNEWSIYNYKDKTCKCKECMLGISKN